MHESFIDSQIQILERCQANWNNLVMPAIQEDLTPFGLPGMTKTAIANSFPMVIYRLKKIREMSLETSSPFLIQTNTQNFTSWTNPMESWISATISNPSGNVSNIVSHLNAMWSQLNAYDSQVNIQDWNQLLDDISSSKTQASNLVGELTGKIHQFEEKRDAVLGQCDAILTKATESLAAASRSGMATSFSMRADEYDEPREGWLFLFLMALAAIVAIAFYHIVDRKSVV